MSDGAIEELPGPESEEQILAKLRGLELAYYQSYKDAWEGFIQSIESAEEPLTLGKLEELISSTLNSNSFLARLESIVVLISDLVDTDYVPEDAVWKLVQNNHWQFFVEILNEYIKNKEQQKYETINKEKIFEYIGSAIVNNNRFGSVVHVNVDTGILYRELELRNNRLGELISLWMKFKTAINNNSASGFTPV